MVGEEPKKAGAAQLPAPKVFNCPSCGAGVLIRAQGVTVSVACSACGSLIDAANENYQVLQKAANNLKFEPVIPLGQRGRLHGTLWEVIGFMRRASGDGAYTWGEYLLFNPFKGYRWLTEFDGHWNYVVSIKEKPVLSRTPRVVKNGRLVASVLGKDYYLFHKGTAKVIYVAGEFYWRVKVDEKVFVRDYVAPPEMLSLESNDDEEIWSIGEYVAADTIRSAFQVTRAMPVRVGVAPNQPSTFTTSSAAVAWLWAGFVAAIFSIQFMGLVFAKNEVAYRGSFTYRVDDPEKQKVSPQFELKHGTTNVQFKLGSPVSNSWLSIEADMVNAQTGETFEFEQGVEYYSGYDSDGFWSEGSQVSHELLSSVPAGLYHLNIQASGPAKSQAAGVTSEEGQPYSLTVTRDVTIWGNFFWSLLLVSLFSGLVWWASHSFEVSRWSTSDFSPYWSEENEE